MTWLLSTAIPTDHKNQEILTALKQIFGNNSVGFTAAFAVGESKISDHFTIEGPPFPMSANLAKDYDNTDLMLPEDQQGSAQVEPNAKAYRRALERFGEYLGMGALKETDVDCIPTLPPKRIITPSMNIYIGENPEAVDKLLNSDPLLVRLNMLSDTQWEKAKVDGVDVYRTQSEVRDPYGVAYHLAEKITPKGQAMEDRIPKFLSKTPGKLTLSADFFENDADLSRIMNLLYNDKFQNVVAAAPEKQPQQTAAAGRS